MADASKNPLSSHPEPAPAIWKPALKETTWAFLAAAVLLIIVYALAFKYIHPEFERFMGRDATALTATGKDFIPVSVGKGRKEGSQYIIEDFNGDEAILALPRAFRAEDYPFIKVNLSGFTRYSKAKILWRQAGDSTIHALELNRSGDGATQIAMVYGHEHYRGQIADIALLFYEGPALGIKNNSDVEVIVKSIEFRLFSTWRVAEQVLEDWTNPPLWKGSAHNTVVGAHVHSVLAPNLMTNLVVITAMAIIWAKSAIVRGGKRRVVTCWLCVCLAGYGLNECLRWQWRLAQIQDAEARYSGLPLETRITRNDLRCTLLPNDCGAQFLPYF